MARRFRTKDLTINVGAAEDIAIGPQFCFRPISRCPDLISRCDNAFSRVCIWPSFECWPHSIIGCGVNFSTCPGAFSVDFPNQINQVVLPPEQFDAMKQELKSALAAIEAREAEVAATEQPQTVEEAEELEGKLKEALQEVSKLKKKLAKG